MTYLTTSRQRARSAGYRCRQDSRRRHYDVGCNKRGCSEVCNPSHMLTAELCAIYILAAMFLFFFSFTI